MKSKDEIIKSLEGEIENLTGSIAKLQAYEQIFEYMISSVSEVKLERPKTITCKYRLLHGTSRKRNNGHQCPPDCQVLITKANREWGKGCQKVHSMKQRRAYQER